MQSRRQGTHEQGCWTLSNPKCRQLCDELLNVGENGPGLLMIGVVFSQWHVQAVATRWQLGSSGQAPEMMFPLLQSASHSKEGAIK